MKLLLLLFVALIFALFGAIHGLRTKELNSVAKSYNKKINEQWHRVQLVLHGVIAVAVAFHNFSVVGFIISFMTTLAIIWTVFDLSHNLSAGQPWWYAENKGLNGTVKKVVKTDRMLLLVKAIVLTGLLITYFLWT